MAAAQCISTPGHAHAPLMVSPLESSVSPCDRPPNRNRCNSNRGWNPSPEEIAAACAEIQAGWSRREHRMRAGQFYTHDRSVSGSRKLSKTLYQVIRWQAPVVSVRGMGVPQ